MSAREDQVRSLIAQDAADWFVASRAGLTDHERNRFATWLKASPVHVEEYLALEIIGRNLREACEESESFVDQLLARAGQQQDAPLRPAWPSRGESLRTPRPRWQAVGVAMAALAAVSLGLLGLWRGRYPAPVSAPNTTTAIHFQTRHGEQQTHRLADSSILHLNTDTQVTVRYGDSERLVVLDSGEADFEVVHEPARPFRVLAGPAQILDLGTKFDVRMGGKSTLITVVEGRVAVSLSSSGQGNAASHGQGLELLQVDANHQISVEEGGWPAALVVVDAQRTTAWLHRQIVFDREPLERVAGEFNRYSRIPIEITSPALRSLEISGVFATDDTRGFIAFLRSLKGVRVEMTPTRILVSGE